MYFFYEKAPVSPTALPSDSIIVVDFSRAAYRYLCLRQPFLAHSILMDAGENTKASSFAPAFERYLLTLRKAASRFSPGRNGWIRPRCAELPQPTLCSKRPYFDLTFMNSLHDSQLFLGDEISPDPSPTSSLVHLVHKPSSQKSTTQIKMSNRDWHKVLREPAQNRIEYLDLAIPSSVLAVASVSTGNARTAQALALVCNRNLAQTSASCIPNDLTAARGD